MSAALLHPAIGPGRLAVIAGSSSGIGLALAKFYARAGMSVAMGDLNGERLARAKGEVEKEIKEKATVTSHSVDVGDEKSVKAFKEAALK